MTPIAKRRSERLDLYLAAARVEASALTDPGGPYGRVIARPDVATGDVLRLCRHQAETAASIARTCKTLTPDFRIGTVAVVVARAKLDALAFVCRTGRAIVDPVADAGIPDVEHLYGVPRDVYVTHLMAESVYYAEEGEYLAIRFAAPLAEAATKLHRYGSPAAAAAAYDFELATNGERLPTPTEILRMSVTTAAGLAKRYPLAYGTQPLPAWPTKEMP
jgi:hypothetical protein